MKPKRFYRIEPQPLHPDVEKVFGTIWPEIESGGLDWFDKWHSFPLSKL
jgi:hypothetical protein